VNDIIITPRLDAIVRSGNRGHFYQDREDSKVTCLDGFTLSVVAGGGIYCSPRPAMCIHLAGIDHIYEPMGRDDAPHDYPGPYDEVEVGFPSLTPQPWDEWSRYAEDPEDPTGTVYSYVPVDMVRALVESHGGEL